MSTDLQPPNEKMKCNFHTGGCRVSKSATPGNLHSLWGGRKKKCQRTGELKKQEWPSGPSFCHFGQVHQGKSITGPLLAKASITACAKNSDLRAMAQNYKNHCCGHTFNICPKKKMLFPRSNARFQSSPMFYVVYCSPPEFQEFDKFPPLRTPDHTV